MFEITDIKITKIEGTSRCKGVSTIVIDNCFAINDIKIIESLNGLFIAMPSRKTPNGEFKDIAHPINSETREKIQKAILESYKNI